VNILGWDIGGVNTKAAVIKTRKGTVRELKTAIKYFPIWKKDKEKLPAVLEKLKNQLTGSTKLDGVGVAMTAELSDAYQTKRKGVIISSIVWNRFFLIRQFSSWMQNQT